MNKTEVSGGAYDKTYGANIGKHDESLGDVSAIMKGGISSSDRRGSSSIGTYIHQSEPGVSSVHAPVSSVRLASFFNLSIRFWDRNLPKAALLEVLL